MVPIATVPGEPGRIEAEDGADLTRAQPRDQTIESRARHRSACRATEIVVNDLNVNESALMGKIDQIVLTPLALQVGHDL